ncbi:MAG: hypothetical protein LBU89_09285, partial [Fibromonadaceae bacterium]|nr:hypothetical protein [Fibromonadaceae bacterium]
RAVFAAGGISGTNLNNVREAAIWAQIAMSEALKEGLAGFVTERRGWSSSVEVFRWHNEDAKAQYHNSIDRILNR